ncbi:MAG: hotdog domain-containing protein, partial [Nakamurella sp.]
GPREITLRFMAAPTDVATLGDTVVAGGRVLEWIDKGAYACAVGWSGGYCVTAYVGNVNFARPIESGDVVEVEARLVHTGRSSMSVEVVVSSAPPHELNFVFATSCTVIFVSVGQNGRPIPVAQWIPITDDDRERDALAIEKTSVRADIAAAMAEQKYTDATTAPRATLRFLAAPTDVNWGGKTHGGTVMRWIDEAAFVCAAGWSRQNCVAAYSGGIRFYRPIMIGDIVEVEARLLHTGRSSLHVSVHVRSGDPKNPQMQLTTHCLTIFVALDEQGKPSAVPRWEPRMEEDRRLDTHAQHLMQLRSRLAPVHPS